MISGFWLSDILIFNLVSLEGGFLEGGMERGCKNMGMEGRLVRYSIRVSFMSNSFTYNGDVGCAFANDFWASH
jgi:hypothetical protein